MSKTIYHDASGTPISAGSDVSLLPVVVDSTLGSPALTANLWATAKVIPMTANYSTTPRTTVVDRDCWVMSRVVLSASVTTTLDLTISLNGAIIGEARAAVAANSSIAASEVFLAKAGDTISYSVWSYLATTITDEAYLYYYPIVHKATLLTVPPQPEAVDITNTLVWEPEFIPDATYTKAIRQGDKIHIKIYCQVNDTGIGSAQMFTIPNVTLYPHVATGFIEGTGVYPMNSSGLNNNTFYTGPDYSGAANMEMGDHFNAVFTVFIKS